MKKILSVLLITFLFPLNSFAGLELEDLKEAQPAFYRLGPTDSPERKIDFDIQPTVAPVAKKEITVKDKQNLTYADLSIKKMAMEISKTIDIDYAEMQADLSLLWQGAATVPWKGPYYSPGPGSADRRSAPTQTLPGQFPKAFCRSPPLHPGQPAGNSPK